MASILALLIVFVFVAECIQIPLGVRQTNTLSTSLGRILKPGHSNKRTAGWRIPLTGNLTYWGEYFTSVGLGTPAQYVNLQVDSGSSDLIVYAAGCDSCNASLTYDASASTSNREIMCDDDQYTCYTPNNDCDGTDQCAWEDQFGDGSTIDGVVYEDLITIGNKQSTSSISLGAIQSVDAPNGFEAFGVDGIWGLAFQDLSGWGGDPAIEILFSDFSLYNSFDLCLGTNGGIMGIGEDYSQDSRFQWTDITQDQWYSVYMTDWRFGDVSLNVSQTDLNWNGVIVDSGTTLLIAPYWIFNPIKAYLTSLCSSRNLVGVCGAKPGQSLFDNQCFSMTAAQVAMFPPLTIAFTGIQGLTIGPDDYLWQGAGTPGVYCLGIQDYDDSLPVIIGDVFMQNFHVVFDRQADKVGFGPLSSCGSR